MFHFNTYLSLGQSDSYIRKKTQQVKQNEYNEQPMRVFQHLTANKYDLSQIGSKLYLNTLPLVKPV